MPTSAILDTLSGYAGTSGYAHSKLWAQTLGQMLSPDTGVTVSLIVLFAGLLIGVLKIIAGKIRDDQKRYEKHEQLLSNMANQMGRIHEDYKSLDAKIDGMSNLFVSKVDIENLELRRVNLTGYDSPDPSNPGGVIKGWRGRQDNGG